ncbi:MAG TPA: anti-sigma factor antagonist [Armatimonadetes bacterium]|nr:anti-sigma factor antagonist [Armatimonadota bacterium]
MEIRERKVDNFVIVSLQGRFDAHIAFQVEEYLLPLLRHAQDLILNFAATEYISSAGLRVLLSLAREAEQNGYDLRLAELRPEVYEVFDIAGFTSLFQIYPTEADALAGTNPLSS